ncbi:MAG: protein-L-isoaspartate O-methyltransferase [Rhodospirillales bacterium]
MDFELARRHMVDSQVLPNKVTDPALIEAMSDVPREAFVPDSRKSLAYCDEAIEVAPGRFLMEPMVAARLLESVGAKDGDVALVIGAATGYLAALLSRMVDTVVVVESDSGLAAATAATLTNLGIDNAVVMENQMNDGYPKQAPYDVIVFDGSVSQVPEGIAQQLAENGRLVAVVGGTAGVPGRAMLTTRFHGALSSRHLFDAGTPALPGFEQPASFTF